MPPGIYWYNACIPNWYTRFATPVLHEPIPMTISQAPGAPGIAPRWTSSAKEGIGTAYSTGSRVWFTLSHGIVNEIYYPHVDSPNTRDLQLLISDGETFVHEEKCDLIHSSERPDPQALLYRQTNTAPDQRYRIIKEVIGEPHSDVVLVSVKMEILDATLADKLKVYVLLAPHVKDTGGNNTARTCEVGGSRLLHAEREQVHLVLGVNTEFVRRSVGFVGTSDGWNDLQDNFQMDWQYEEAAGGNVAMMGEVDLSRGREFTIGVSLGDSRQSAATSLLQAFAIPFAQQRTKFIEQWKRVPLPELSHDADTQALVQLSQHVLLAHEDKEFAGATVASMSIPWGETKDDSDSGGYHLVWARDMVQTTTALLASGEMDLPLRSLVWLACVQGEDGGMPQNSRIDGSPYWEGVQLDEVAAPVLLAWRLQDANALQNFDPMPMVRRAMRFLLLHGPVTAQERWEENSGYSPSTLAIIISAIVCAADLVRSERAEATDNEDTRFLLDYADWMVASLEGWTVTNCGELVPGKPRHYIRITPEAPQSGPVEPNPNIATINIANGGGEFPARNVVDAGFLQLARLGIRRWDDPVIVDSVAVVDAMLKRELPQGPCWRRYNHDGYGQHTDGSAFNGTGEGRVWPLLTGERGHYEIACGRDVTRYIEAMKGFASGSGLFAEQLWDTDDIPQRGMYFGKPAGSAMPLCWAHAEFISLVRSQKDERCYDRIEPVYRRYSINQPENHLEVWTFAHQPIRISAGKRLRLICEHRGRVHWSTDQWATRHDSEMTNAAFGLHFIDLPIEDLLGGQECVFTFHWSADDRWEDTNYVVKISS